MNLVTTSNSAPVTMTSLDLVDYINSHRETGEAELRHRDFTAKVPKVLGEEMSEKFRTSLKDAYGRDQPGFSFPKREACLMAMSYSYDLQAKVFDKMTELEEKAKSFAALPDFNNPAIAARAWADQVESRQMAETKLALVAPKAEALDRIADADGTMNLTLAAKALQAQPKKLFNWLREKHWIYRRPGGSGNIAYQDKIQAGLLTHKVTTVQREDGTDKVVEQVLVTGKGLAKLAESFMAKGCAA